MKNMILSIKQTIGIIACSITVFASPIIAQDAETIQGTVGKAIADIVKNANATSGFSGVVLAELDGVVIAVVATGSRNDEKANPNTTETLFEIASATKPLTAMAVLALAEQGKLALDDPINKYLPNVPDDCNSITIRQLIQHTSGIPGTNYGPYSHDVETVVPIYLKGGPQHLPGTHHEYWNQGYSLLSAIIARVNKTSYSDAVRQLIYEPAGMSHSCFTGDSTKGHNNVAIGRSIHGAARSALEPPYRADYGLQYQGMGGAICSVHDLHRMIESIRNGNLLKEETVKRMLDPGSDEWTYALGWKIDRVNETQRRVFHTGSVRGFLSSVSWYPEDNSSLIVFSNSDNAVPVFAVEADCRSLLEREFVKTPEKQQFADAFIQSICGVYTFGKRTVTIKAEGPRLAMLLDWGGPKTGGWLEKGDKGELFFCTNSREMIKLIPSLSGDGPVSSFKLMKDEYQRK